MNNYKRIRVREINSWPSSMQDPTKSSFNVIKIFSEKIKNNSGRVFVPIKVQEKVDVNYNIFLGNFLECLDLLPYKVDISFDIMWKTFEKILKITRGESNVTNILKSIPIDQTSDIFASPQYGNVIKDLCKVIPLQACEYIAKNIKEATLSNVNLQNQKSFYVRLISFDKNSHVVSLPTLHDFLSRCDAKYSKTPEDMRKLSRLIQLYMKGEAISIDGISFQASLSEQISILINGLIYTYRCERAHGDRISPFKSSTAKLSTYAFCYYCFISVYSMFLILLFPLYHFSENEICDNVSNNIINYVNLFGSTIRR